MADIKETKEVEVVIKAKADEQSIKNAENKINKLEKKISGKSAIKRAPVRFYKGKQYTVEDRPFDRMKERIRSRGVFSEIRSRISSKNTAGIFSEISDKWSGVGSAFKTSGGITNSVKRKFNDKINKIMSNSMISKAKGMLKSGGASKPYDNSPFRKAMMYIGSGMLLQYAVMIAGRAIAGVLNSVSSTEVENLTGLEYRKELSRKGANVKRFDETYKLYSERTGTAKYASRARFGRLYGKLSTAGVSTGFDPETMVRVMRGMQFMTGESEEQVDKRLYKLLSGRAGKEERKEFGVTSTNSPTAILNEIHNTLKKNAAARVGMDNILLQDRLKAIASAPTDMLNMVHSFFPTIFEGIADSFKDFVLGIFESEPGDTQMRWVAFFENIRQLTDELFSKEGGATLANSLLDTIGPIIAGITEIVKAMKEFNKESNNAIGRLFAISKKFNSISTIFNYSSGVISWISESLAHVLDKMVSIVEVMIDLPGKIKRFIFGSDDDDENKVPDVQKPANAIGGNISKYLPKVTLPNLQSSSPMQGMIDVGQVGEWDPTFAQRVERPSSTGIVNIPSFDENVFMPSTYSSRGGSGNIIHANNVYIQDGQTAVDNMMNGVM